MESSKFSSFGSFKIKENKKELELELKILKESLKIDMPAGDYKVLEKKIKKVEKKLSNLELEVEATVAGDIASTQTNLFANCTGKEDCECGKCQILRKEKLKESKIFSPFEKIFGA